MAKTSNRNRHKIPRKFLKRSSSTYVQNTSNGNGQKQTDAEPSHGETVPKQTASDTTSSSNKSETAVIKPPVPLMNEDILRPLALFLTFQFLCLAVDMLKDSTIGWTCLAFWISWSTLVSIVMYNVYTDKIDEIKYKASIANGGNSTQR